MPLLFGLGPPPHERGILAPIVHDPPAISILLHKTMHFALDELLRVWFENHIVIQIGPADRDTLLRQLSAELLPIRASDLEKWKKLLQDTPQQSIKRTTASGPSDH